MATTDGAISCSTVLQLTALLPAGAAVKVGTVGKTGLMTVVSWLKTPVANPKPEATMAPIAPATRATAQVRVG